MTIRRAVRQMSAEAERSGRQQGEALSAPVSDEALGPRHEPEDTGSGLLHAVLARGNMQQAWKRVRANKGAAGVDGLGIDETAERLCTDWPLIREQLLRKVLRPGQSRHPDRPSAEEDRRCRSHPVGASLSDQRRLDERHSNGSRRRDAARLSVVSTAGQRDAG